MVVGKVLVIPRQNLLTRVGIGGVASDVVMDGRERVGKSRGRHC